MLRKKIVKYLSKKLKMRNFENYFKIDKKRANFIHRLKKLLKNVKYFDV